MAEVIMHTYKLRRGTLAEWERINPILDQGEPGFAYDYNVFKIGDGFTPWNALPSINSGSIFNALTRNDFPRVGKVDIIYKAQEEVALYQWNDIIKNYELLSAGEQLLDELIKDIDEVREDIDQIKEMLNNTLVIYGGSATGNIILQEVEE